MEALKFLVLAAFFAVVVAGSAPSEATDQASDVSAQRARGQAVTATRGARGPLSRKRAAPFDAPQADVVAGASAGRRSVQKVRKHPHEHHHKRPSPGGETAGAGDRKMLRPPCVTEQECVSKKLFCFKKCSGPMNLQEDPNCLIKCANCFPTC